MTPSGFVGCQHYIRGREFLENEAHPKDSSVWLAILHAKPSIEACVTCGTSYTTNWILSDFKPTTANIYSFF